MEPIDPVDLRVSDSDRNTVAEILREAAGDGRIDFAELDERLEAAYAAKTYRDLVPITLDLGHALPPAPSPPPPPSLPVPAVPPTPSASSVPARLSPPGTPATHSVSVAVLSESRRTGVWDVGSSYSATAFMGSVVIDLREARFPAGEVVINAAAVMGGVEVIIDAGTVVIVEGIAIMGSFEEGRAKVAPEVGAGSPVVRVRGLALMGSVEVRRTGPPGELGRSIRKHLGR